MTTDAPNNFETLYKSAVESAELSPVSRAVANAVIQRLVASNKAPVETELAERIEKAAAARDTQEIFRLADRLKQVKADEEAQSARLREIAGEFTFAEVLKAFPVEFNDLVHELGLIALQVGEQARTTSRGRGSSRPAPKPPVYIISYRGKSIEATRSTGAAKSPGREPEFYEFLGFQVSEDGRRISPSTIPNNEGVQVTATKNSIIDGILAGQDYWEGQGYTAKEKQV